MSVRTPVADERVVRADANPTAEALRWTALGLVAVLSVAGTLGLHSLTADWSILVPATIGAAGAAAVVEGSRRFELLVGESFAASVIAFVVVGAVVVGVLPTPGAFVDFFEGLTKSWADLLSAVTPTDLTPSLRVAPFALAWFGTLVGGSLLRWVRQPGLPILGPLSVLAVTVLLTDEDRAVSLLVGAAIAVGALAVGLLQQWIARTAGASHDDGRSVVGAATSSRRGRLVAAGGVLALVAVAAPLVGPQLPLAESRERFDLRDRVVPPWDPLALPSPLVQVKAALAADREEDVVFEVRSDTPVTRWSLAVMGSYDGVVWTVADSSGSRGEAAAEFRPVGSRLPAPAVQPVSDPTLTASVDIVDLAGPWLPVPGVVRELRFDDLAGATAPLVRENIETGTLAIADGVAPGTTYTVTALVPPERSDDELTTYPIEETGSDFDLEVLPPQINNLAADITEGIDFGWGQVAAVRDRFTATGFYDKSTNTPPGHSYFRLAQFLADPDETIGFEEQYAAGAAVVTRIAGLPTRVVAGFEIPADRYTNGVAEVRSGDASAWIEVRVEGVGWVPVSVTPPRSREPDTEAAITPEEQVATPNPPPPPQVPPDVDVVSENRELEEPVEEEEEEEEDEDAVDGAGIGLLGWLGIGAGVLLGLLVAFCVVVVAWKRRRMRRRREAPEPSLRIAGAWSEVADRYDEAGVPIAPRSTPLEAARSFMTTEPSAQTAAPRLLALVGTVDRAAYHADAPGDAESDAAWQYHDDVVQALLDDRTLPQRAQMRLDPRPLFRRDAWGRAQAGTASGDEAEDDVMNTHHDIDQGDIDDSDIDDGLVDR
ncbi:MAG TPA: transglutaminaseTgpA domain-containing protein [Ilumatobacteraceae bacterium]|nr:transglutaminaseTgpA domain-containing protein [Ilumatobacteraceae bacterium]